MKRKPPDSKIVSDEVPTQALLKSLARAVAAYELGDRVGGQLASVIAIHKFLLATGCPPKALVPFQNLMHTLATDRRKKGTRIMDGNAFIMGAAAAAVTTLNQRDRQPIAEAVKTVSSAAGLDQQKLRNFRDNLNRGLVTDQLALISYKGVLAEIELISKKEIIAALRLWGEAASRA
jgi:hypothetical protein